MVYRVLYSSPAEFSHSLQLYTGNVTGDSIFAAFGPSVWEVYKWREGEVHI